MLDSDSDGRRIAVGRINGTWGLHGHVKVTPLTSNSQRFQPDAVLLVNGQPHRVLDVATPQGYPCVRFEGYASRDLAQALRGALIEIEESDLPALPQDQYYLHDLVGLAVVTTGGRELGRLHEVLRTGANDVYVVRGKGRKEALIPAIPDVVLQVDLEAGRMVIAPLEGLLPG